MEEFYLLIRTVHICAVSASGVLFALRGGAFNLLNAAWPRSLWVRRLSLFIDTILLGAALTLMVLVRQFPFVDHWQTVKVTLLIVYIGLGTQAFATGRPRPVRVGFWLAALAVFGFIVTVARTNQPLGLLAGAGA